SAGYHAPPSNRTGKAMVPPREPGLSVRTTRARVPSRLSTTHARRVGVWKPAGGGNRIPRYPQSPAVFRSAGAIASSLLRSDGASAVDRTAGFGSFERRRVIFGHIVSMSATRLAFASSDIVGGPATTRWADAAISSAVREG